MCRKLHQESNFNMKQSKYLFEFGYFHLSNRLAWNLNDVIRLVPRSLHKQTWRNVDHNTSVGESIKALEIKDASFEAVTHKKTSYYLRRDQIFDLNCALLVSCKEAAALLACGAVRCRGSSRRRERHDSSPGFRWPSRRFVNPKNMGSNVSRRSGKGLSGRRAQSSGSLCKILVPRVGRVFQPCGERGVKRRDRNKFSGSLPNRLDDKEASSRNSSSVSFDGDLENLFGEPRKVELLLRKLLPPQDFGGGDQGYDSERSPDDVDSPPEGSGKDKCYRHSIVRTSREIRFITKENIFEAQLEKGSRGLGLSVTGGIDTEDRYPGLIRIKRIFPHQPAWECGVLALGDIILEANGSPLTGLSNHEALEVLRTTPNKVILKICRPPAEMFPISVAFEDNPPVPPKRDLAQHIPVSSQLSNSSNALPQSSLPFDSCGEFEVILTKVNGSLGFTLRKEDESILGHYIRALVREPAISDERIRPGDKIVSVNGADISSMSHEEAVAFLRRSSDQVRLRLYRDPVQTPVSALSPAESHKTFRPKPALRKEAVDMLCDLAIKKFAPSGSAEASRPGSMSPSSSPRRRRLIRGTTRKEEFALETALDSLKNAREPETVSRLPSQPVSMPPFPSCSPEFDLDDPVYRSVRPAAHSESNSGLSEASVENVPDMTPQKEGGGSKSLLKWKGVVFAPEEGSPEEPDEDQESIAVELCRGWNSRLGFGLRSEGSATLISAIYPDSVAAKDGRLQPGDKVIMINGESTKKMSTSEMIDLLRKIRGTVVLTVLRKKDFPKTIS